jgi:hypothetical protein
MRSGRTDINAGRPVETDNGKRFRARLARRYYLDPGVKETAPVPGC